MRIAFVTVLVLASVTVLVGALLAWADARFQAGADAAERALLATVPRAAAAPVTPADLDGLPRPVRRWLECDSRCIVLLNRRLHVENYVLMPRFAAR